MTSILVDFCSRKLELIDMEKLHPTEIRRRNRDRFISKFKKEDPSIVRERITKLYENVQEEFNKILQSETSITKEQKTTYFHNLSILEREINPNFKDPKPEFPEEHSFEFAVDSTEEEISSLASEFELVSNERKKSIFYQSATEELSDPKIKGYHFCVPFAFIEAAQVAYPEKNIYYARWQQTEENPSLMTDIKRLKAELDEKRISEGLIFIPMGLKGFGINGLLHGTFSEDHATLVAVRFSNNWENVAIEYYDPKNQGKIEKHTCVDGENLKTTLDHISDTFKTASGEKQAVQISSTKDQSRTNTTDCALHVVHHMTRWIQGDMALLKKPIDQTRVETLDFIQRYLTPKKEEKKEIPPQKADSWAMLEGEESLSDDDFS